MAPGSKPGTRHYRQGQPAAAITRYWLRVSDVAGLRENV
jgi:hypothetical protein